MADAKAPEFKKWLMRECCNTVVEVNKKYGALEPSARFASSRESQPSPIASRPSSS